MEAAYALNRARNPMATVPLGSVTRPSAIAFHPGGDTLVIGGEKNTIFVRQVRDIEAMHISECSCVVMDH